MLKLGLLVTDGVPKDLERLVVPLVKLGDKVGELVPL